MKIPECLDDYTCSHTLPPMFCTPTFPGSSASRNPGLKKENLSSSSNAGNLHRGVSSLLLNFAMT